MNNEEMAKIFFEIADILEDQGVEYKPAAYRKAARTIDQSPVAMKDVYEEGGVKALIAIPTIGEHIAAKIEEMVKTGKLKYYDKLMKGRRKE
jgi:DNA polymerase (family 10)